MQEKDLILQAKNGDVGAFEELVMQNAQYVYNLALRVTKDPHEAEDISQEVFIRVWKAIKNFRMESSFRTWLYRIVANQCYDRLPKLKQDLAALDPDEDIDLFAEDDLPEATLMSGELRQHLHAAIDQLPEGYRLLITLRHLQEMSYAEIAEVTGQPLGTVKTGIHRARRQLYDKIKAYGTENE